MQVVSRLVLVWGIVDNFPQETSTSPAYSSMLLAWSFTEVIRYSYFVMNLRGGVPEFLTWLRFVFLIEGGNIQSTDFGIGARYNTFYVLYPMGISSEMWLIYKSIKPAKERAVQYEYLLRGILFLYIPGRSHAQYP